MIGHRLAAMASGESGGGSVLLDWLASDGTLEVVTDFMYELTTWPVEADVRVDELMDYDNGSWRAVAAAGSQSHSMQKMSVCAQFSRDGVPGIGVWMNNGIYNPENRGVTDIAYNGRFRKFVVYQTSDYPVQSTAIVECDGQSATCSDPGWGTITGNTVPPCPVTFFFCLDPVDGAHLQHSKSSVRRLAIYSSPSLGEKLAEFVPAMDSDMRVGMLDNVSGKFYPASGNGVMCLDGEEIPFYNGRFPDINHYDYPDWLQPVDSPVFTDWMLDSVVHPIRLRFQQTSAPERDQEGMLFACGGRTGDEYFDGSTMMNDGSTLVMFIQAGRHSAGEDFYVCPAYYDFVYMGNTDGAFTAWGPSAQGTVDVAAWKDEHGQFPRGGVHLRGTDASGNFHSDVVCEDPGFTTGTSTVPQVPQRVSFFGSVKAGAVDGDYLFPTRYARLYECEILTSSTDDTVLARFVPALNYKGEPGLREMVSGKFYPCGGKVSGYYSLGGEEVTFGKPGSGGAAAPGAPVAFRMNYDTYTLETDGEPAGELTGGSLDDQWFNLNWPEAEPYGEISAYYYYDDYWGYGYWNVYGPNGYGYVHDEWFTAPDGTQYAVFYYYSNETYTEHYFGIPR